MPTSSMIHLVNGHFAGWVGLIGENCAEVSVEEMRSSIIVGFKNVFQQYQMEFTVTHMDPMANSVTGVCTIPEWQQGEGRNFDCNWEVFLVPKK